MPSIEDIINQLGNETTPADQIRRLAEIVSESTDAMSATTDRLEQKAAQLHNHEATVGTAVAAGHVRAGSGLEILSDGTLNVALTAEGIVRRPLSVVPQPGAVPVAGADGTLGDWAIPPVLATQTTPGIVKGSDTVEIGEDGSVNVVGGGAVVITTPIITGPSSASIGYAVPYTTCAASGLQNGSIASFKYKFGTGAEQTVNATDGSATIPITVPAGTAVGVKFTLIVTAVDNYGNERATTKEIAAIAASVTTPTLTSPAAGAIVSAASIPITGTAFSVTGSAPVTQKARRGRACTPEGTVLFTGPWVTGSAVTALSLAPSPALPPEASVTLQIQDEGNALGESPWSAPVTVTISSVVQPSITSPAANAEVSDKNITVVTAAMALTGSIADTLVGADYTLYDTSGGVIASAKGIAATSHVFATPVVTKGPYYDIGVVQHSKNHGSSPESAKRRIKIRTTRHGEILYDTSGNPAAVITGSYASNGNEPWNIRGKQVWIAVALAAKRSMNIRWSTSNNGIDRQDIPSIENPSVSWKLANSNTGDDSSGGCVSSQSTEAHMDGTFTYSQPVKDSKALTDAIVAHSSDHQAAIIARQLVLKDLGAMDLPSIDVLMRIYQMRDKIDALDPTASANTANKLAAWGFGSFYDHVWSASEYDYMSAWSVAQGGSFGRNYKFPSPSGFVPALEIPA